MDKTIYDKTVADPWFGVQPFLISYEKPLVLAFIRKPQPGFPDIVTAKDSFVMKTLYLLSEDYHRSFNFAFVDHSYDKDWIGQTFNLPFYKTDQMPIIMLV
jgi:hypothetical protein